MNSPSRHPKSVSVTFRGLNCHPEKIELLLGRPASSTGVKGDPVKPTVATRLTRSYARYEVDLQPCVQLDEVFDVLMQHVGGVDALIRARDEAQPEFFELDIVWPIKFSEEQESGYLTQRTLADLVKLECTLGFSFL
ncbi:hypothetical protein [Stenotrophomonas sp.]|uniref:hypothetical protein n=1 Tax=Stenotrophomonas sp. TaxID=69392 RepID=UPI002899A666|nr:hypothetical protein [Stenotrophomonas sp.]